MQTMQPALQPRLLIVDDDRDLAQMVSEFLGHEGFAVETTADADGARRALADSVSDALILDVMLPGKNGLELLQELRERYPQLPILMLTARGGADDRIRGLDLGADDYLPKPFDPRELTARLRALLRRSRNPEAAGLRLDLRLRQARWQDRPLDLTGAEFRILQLLLTTRDAPVARETLSERALGRRLLPYDRAIDTHVSNLRRKLARAGADTITIRSVRGAGYELLETHSTK